MRSRLKAVGGLCFEVAYFSFKFSDALQERLFAIQGLMCRHLRVHELVEHVSDCEANLRAHLKRAHALSDVVGRLYAAERRSRCRNVYHGELR
jgi:hypothetical protein